MFKYSGVISSSKSLFNRLLIAQSYAPNLKLTGQSDCQDVTAMKRAIVAMLQKQVIDCHSAGTVFRFMALRASRTAGTHQMVASQRLFSRPQEDVLFILNQLGVKNTFTGKELIIHSEGWKKPLVPLKVHRDKSSQFASSILLNSWDLPFDLQFSMSGESISEGYLLMTLSVVQELGMQVIHKDSSFYIPAGQKIELQNYTIEPDLSSTFAIAVAAVLCGQAEFKEFPLRSLQPDLLFLDLFRRMKIDFKQVPAGASSILTVNKSELNTPLSINISSAPDLFPILSILCAFTEGESLLFGAPHLIFKESDRIGKTIELLELIGTKFEKQSDGLKIFGNKEISNRKFRSEPTVFDPDQDHRMAMAAGILKLIGYSINILNPEVVNKSFPDFWKILGVKP